MRAKEKARQPVTTRRVKRKAKTKRQDEMTNPEEANPNDFLNDSDVVTSSANDVTEPAEAPLVNEDKATDQAVGENSTPLQYTSLPEVKEKKENYEQYRPYFLHVPVEKIRKTFENTTQHATNIVSGPKIHQTIQSPYPAYNVRRRNEPVATDTIFAEVPAVDTNGMKMCQIFVGRKSLVIDVFGMHNNAEFVNTLEDVIRKRGAMDKLISDSAKVKISKRVLDILRALCIDDWQSEPQYQHENYAERCWGTLKTNVKWYMNWWNVQANAWLLCTEWCADVMNMTAEKSIGWRTPLEVLTGETTDISIAEQFQFRTTHARQERSTESTRSRFPT
jgi:hypothetical protein